MSMNRVNPLLGAPALRRHPQRRAEPVERPSKSSSCSTTTSRSSPAADPLDEGQAQRGGGQLQRRDRQDVRLSKPAHRRRTGRVPTFGYMSHDSHLPDELHDHDRRAVARPARGSSIGRAWVAATCSRCSAGWAPRPWWAAGPTRAVAPRRGRARVRRPPTLPGTSCRYQGSRTRLLAQRRSKTVVRRTLLPLLSRLRPDRNSRTTP